MSLCAFVLAASNLVLIRPYMVSFDEISPLEGLRESAPLKGLPREGSPPLVARRAAKVNQDSPKTLPSLPPPFKPLPDFQQVFDK